MARRRVAALCAGAAVAARVWWRSGQPPFPMRVAVLVYGLRGHRRGTPEPVRSGPGEALP